MGETHTHTQKYGKIYRERETHTHIYKDVHGQEDSLSCHLFPTRPIDIMQSQSEPQKTISWVPTTDYEVYTKANTRIAHTLLKDLPNMLLKKMTAPLGVAGNWTGSCMLHQPCRSL